MLLLQIKSTNVSHLETILQHDGFLKSNLLKEEHFFVCTNISLVFSWQLISKRNFVEPHNIGSKNEISICEKAHYAHREKTQKKRIKQKNNALVR